MMTGFSFPAFSYKVTTLNTTGSSSSYLTGSWCLLTRVTEILTFHCLNCMPFVSFIFIQIIPKFATRGLQQVTCDGAAVGPSIII